MKTNSPRAWIDAIVVIFAVGIFVSVTSWLTASPSDEISKAVATDGTTDITQADSSSFLSAFTSVLARVDDDQTAAYISAAQKLRPDLKDQIVAAANDLDTMSDETADNGDHRISRHHRLVKICCNDRHTIALPPRKAKIFLHTHPNCERGCCKYTPTPHA